MEITDVIPNPVYRVFYVGGWDNGEMGRWGDKNLKNVVLITGFSIRTLGHLILIQTGFLYFIPIYPLQKQLLTSNFSNFSLYPLQKQLLTPDF